MGFGRGPAPRPGGMGGNRMPGGNPFGMGRPQSRPNHMPDMGDAIGSLIIGGMLASLLSQSNAGDYVNPDTFMGYRIVENVIPLNSAVFTIGDLHNNGGRYYVSRSTNSEAKASYFSARPEEEVIAQMRKKKISGGASSGFAVVLFLAAALCLAGFVLAKSGACSSNEFDTYNNSSGYYSDNYYYDDSGYYDSGWEDFWW